MSNSSFDLFAEVLDKLIDAQMQNAKATADLKNAIELNNNQLVSLHKTMAEVNAHFSNGFRHEIMDHVSDLAGSIKQSIESIEEEHKKQSLKVQQNLNEFIDSIKSPKSWISAFLFVGGLFGTIAAIVSVVMRFLP